MWSFNAALELSGLHGISITRIAVLECLSGAQTEFTIKNHVQMLKSYPPLNSFLLQISCQMYTISKLILLVLKTMEYCAKEEKKVLFE